MGGVHLVSLWYKLAAMLKHMSPGAYLGKQCQFECLVIVEDVPQDHLQLRE